MIPILYSATETVAQLVADKTNGLGRLPDAASCKVTEERNGAFTLEMTYPITGLHYADIAIGGVIKAKPNELADAQLFRIYHITKPLNGVVTIDAQHITYDLGKAVVKPFTAKGIQLAVSSMLKNMIGGSGFSFSSDIENSGSTLTNEIPQSFRAILGGQDGSFLDVFGGEYEWNNAKVILHSHRGSNNGVTIRYGKNLTDIKQEENISETYTAVYPYVLNSDQKVITGSLQTVIETSEPKVLALDLSSKFQSIGAGTEQKDPTAAEINAEAQKYIKANNIGTPKVSIDVSFVQLWQTAEYKNIAPLERVSLCDTVTVQFDKLGVSATAKVIETVYDVLAEHYESISLGDAKSSLAGTVASMPEQIKAAKKTASTDLIEAIQRTTELITGAKGGHVVINQDAEGNPDEILIMDTADKATAVKVWRWNLGGLAYSSTGINGPYTTAITQDGQIVADFIKAGTLSGDVVKAGILKDTAGKNYWNMVNGEISISGVVSEEDAISSVSVEFAQNSSTEYVPSSGWSTSAPAWENGKYIWTRTHTVKANGEDEYSNPACLSGTKGDTGATGGSGASVKSITPQYILTSSNTSAPDSSAPWSNTQPAWSKDHYIWTRTHSVFTNGAESYSDPVLAGALNSANENVESLDNELNQEEILKRLTGGYTTEGLYIQNGHLYINGSAIRAGSISGDRVSGGVLKGATIVFDPDGNPVTAQRSALGNGGVKFTGDGDFTIETQTVGITGKGTSSSEQEVQLVGKDTNGTKRCAILLTDSELSLQKKDSRDSLKGWVVLNDNGVKINGSAVTINGMKAVTSNYSVTCQSGTYDGHTVLNFFLDGTYVGHTNY